jgi:hypothetical protein
VAVLDFLIFASDNFQLILGLEDRDPRLQFEVVVLQPFYRELILAIALESTTVS